MSENYFSKLRNQLTILILMLLPTGLVLGQGFTEVPMGIPGFRSSKAAWVDFNNDGKLDLSIAGDDSLTGGFGRSARLFRNTGSGFVQTSATFMPLADPSIKWFDVDRDNDLDFIMMGEDSAGDYRTNLYINTAGNFAPASQTLAGFAYGAFATGDVWNHGGNDLLCVGADANYDPTTILYSNNGTGMFQNSGQTLSKFIYGDAKLFDADNDGDLDLLLGGDDDNGTYTNGVYPNVNGAFGPGLWTGPTPTVSSFSLGDIDSDGDMDIAVSGNLLGQRYTDLYQNNGGLFTPMLAGIRPVYGSNFLGDLDNDGDLDFSESGSAPGGDTTKIYLNTSGNFADTGVPLPGIAQGQSIFGDYDNDGALDLFMTGEDASNLFISKVFHNDFSVHNTAPTAPTGLSAIVNPDSSITLSWQASTDVQTASAGLSYSLMIGITANGTEITAPPADPATGFRRLVEFGEVTTTTWTLQGVSCAFDYYFRVQAVDGGYMGSPFSAPLLVALSPAATITQNGNTLFLNSTGPSIDSVQWVDGQGAPLANGNGTSYVLSSNMTIGVQLFSGFCSTTIPATNWIFVGIDNAQVASDVKMWPNPTSTQLHIRIDNPTATEAIAIYDMQGRLMREVREHFSNEVLIPVEGLTSGLYLVKMSLSEGRGIETGMFRKD